MFAPFAQENFPAWLPLVCVSAISLVALLVIITSAVRIIPEYARMVVFRLGRLAGTVGPGIVFVLPFIDRGVQVDLREKKEMINGEATTQDNARFGFQIGVGYRIVNPEKSVLSVPDLPMSLREATRARLKSIVGDVDTAQALQMRPKIEMELKNRLGEAVNLWGCELTSVEILEVARV
ncbi:MAG: SPFH/Band 7/PHB domain protein [Anaerolineales bacterium]|nr:SPFH/Band 7/PHB domain protein [Anaerolineales bacterium]